MFKAVTRIYFLQKVGVEKLCFRDHLKMEDGMDLSDGEEEPLPQAPSFQKPPSQIQGLPVRPREELTTYGYTKTYASYTSYASYGDCHFF